MTILNGLRASKIPEAVHHGNMFTGPLASLASGASSSFSITVKASKAGTALVLAVAASQNPDPKPLNNIAIGRIAITQ